MSCIPFSFKKNKKVALCRNPDHRQTTTQTLKPQKWQTKVASTKLLKKPLNPKSRTHPQKRQKQLRRADKCQVRAPFAPIATYSGSKSCLASFTTARMRLADKEPSMHRTTPRRKWPCTVSKAQTPRYPRSSSARSPPSS